jgi:hypothetical protein
LSCLLHHHITLVSCTTSYRLPSQEFIFKKISSHAQNLSLWNQPHYRHPSYAHDLRANLCNVAVPGSGLPLSLFCLLLPLGYVLVLLGNPLFSFLGAINVARKKTGQVSFGAALSDAYRQQ